MLAQGSSLELLGACHLRSSLSNPERRRAEGRGLELGSQ